MTDHRLYVANDAVAALFEGVSWPAIVARGVAGVLFGVLAILAPVATALSLVVVFSIYLMADGFLAIASAVKAARERHSWGLLALEGVLNIAASLAIFLIPGLGMITFVAIVAVWALFAGGVKLVTAMRRGPVEARGWLALSAVISLLFGAALLVAPLAGAVVLTWWLGIYGLVFGVVLLCLGFQLRSTRRKAMVAA
ncbi:MAG: HdeD family acid-resistance protein [Pseudomonadota bacterium]|uniref:HdeD family acid-resistance protein n=1 Tax=unclassified Phenylobacterium TaxID=2640670 RepID=UPI0009E753DC|nr:MULTISPECIES: HdeD family acid-resistance protein [unclassified Phenylobacterium]MBT9471153.1 HdeD family acid-resistance protein [Phenylobacterium sp.]